MSLRRAAFLRSRRAERRLAWAFVLAGAALALAIQVAGPVGVPLFDGVVVQEPYRFLHPASADQAGDPGRGEETKLIAGDVSPGFAVATTEQPPQAQLVALGDAFRLTDGATEMRITVEPIEPPAPPAEGSIAGNVYRFTAVDQAGNLIAPKTCEGCLSLVMRAPDGSGDGTIMRFANGAWSAVQTLHAGTVGLYQTNATALGTFAVVVGGPGSGGTGGLLGDDGIDPIILVLGGAIVVIFLALVGLHVWRSRNPGRIGAGDAPTNRIPSKRKRPPKPPAGRSDR
jgi:hypothetical protein